MPQDCAAVRGGGQIRNAGNQVDRAPLDGLTAFRCEALPRLTQNRSSSAAGNLFADIAQTPAVQALARRLENGGALTFSGVAAPAQPFFAALLQKLFPQRPIVVVAENLKAQESFQQDLETWLQVKLRVASRNRANLQPSTFNFNLVLSRLGNSAARRQAAARRRHQRPPANARRTFRNVRQSTARNSGHRHGSVTALLQKTFPPGEIQSRTRALATRRQNRAAGPD